MQYTVNQLYDELYDKVNTIYDVFKGFFGEENVDLQPSISDENFRMGILSVLKKKQIPVSEDMDTPYEISEDALNALHERYDDGKVIIYVWWKEVTVTNEHNKSVNIQDLYAEVEITLEGRIPYENKGFLLNRATYSSDQFIDNYMHSHVSSIPKSNFTCFQSPCLGRGPINRTISTLKTEYDEIIWMLFCQELSMFVTVESISGVPYNYLERIGRKEVDMTLRYYNFANAEPRVFLHMYGQDKLKDFIAYYLKHGHLSISYNDHKFKCGMPYYRYIIDVSNSFIDYYNKYLSKTTGSLDDLYANEIISKVIVSNGIIYLSTKANKKYSLRKYQNQLVLTFKGKEIRTTIYEENKETNDVNLSIIINNSLAMYILKNILRTINFRFKNEYNGRNTGTKEPSTISEKISYL